MIEPPSTMALWFSFLAGGISPFLLGAAVFALLVLMIEFVLKF
jgi:hypothetical protein